MEILLAIVFIAAVFVPQAWYYIAIGKRISEEERKAGRDLSEEINPFTGSR
ncbi:hypothetical protein [Paenibacillus wenxiniae]|uniref:Sporulation protein YhaL n=1 Tax=Paenibacillus wenxiniae TaxID=1636843 RepID=A0ABW4RQ67_9BACL